MSWLGAVGQLCECVCRKRGTPDPLPSRLPRDWERKEAKPRVGARGDGIEGAGGNANLCSPRDLRLAPIAHDQVRFWGRIREAVRCVSTALDMNELRSTPTVLRSTLSGLASTQTGLGLTRSCQSNPRRPGLDPGLGLGPRQDAAKHSVQTQQGPEFPPGPIVAGGAVSDQAASFLRLAFLRSLGSRMALRMRIDLGVTSTISSSSM